MGVTGLALTRYGFSQGPNGPAPSGPAPLTRVLTAALGGNAWTLRQDGGADTIPGRRDRPKSSGAIIWQFNDSWPGQTWSMTDYYHRWKALQYNARHREAGRGIGQKFNITLRSAQPALWTWLNLEKEPDARYSDNFVHLRPGEPVTVRVECARDYSAQDLQAQLEVRSVRDFITPGIPLPVLPPPPPPKPAPRPGATAHPGAASA